MQNVMSDMAFWEGHVVQSVHEQADGSLLINLSEEPHKTACCDQYGQPACFHERRWRRVRERDWFDRRVWLNVQVLRMNCPHCGGRRLVMDDSPYTQGTPSRYSGHGRPKRCGGYGAA